MITPDQLYALLIAFGFVPGGGGGGGPYLQIANNLNDVASKPTSRANLQVGAISQYAGNPNGHVAGAVNDIVIDTTDGNVLYLCTTAGNTASAVWALQGVTQAQVIGLTAALAALLPLSGGTMTGNLLLNGNATQALQAVPYQQIQSLISGFRSKDACQAAATANYAATYNNGTAGVGATLTLTATGTVVFDSTYVPSLGDRIWFPSQTSGIQNGIYILTTLGAIGISAVFTRATDFDNSSSGLIQNGDFFEIENGNTYGGTSWYVNNTGAIVLGTTALTFAPYNYMLAVAPLSKPTPNSIALNIPGQSAASAATFADLILAYQGSSYLKESVGQIADLLFAGGVAPVTYTSSQTLATPISNYFVVSVSVSITITVPAFTGNLRYGQPIVVNNLGSTSAIVIQTASTFYNIPAGVIAILYVKSISPDQFSTVIFGTMAFMNAASAAITGGDISGATLGNAAGILSLLFTGSNQSPLSTYEFTQAFTSTFTWGSVTSGAITLTCIRIGRKVSVYLPSIAFSNSSSQNSTIAANSNLPSRFMPANPVVQSQTIQNPSGTVALIGRFIILTTGQIVIQGSLGANIVSSASLTTDPISFEYFV